jgi:hypothetical protein
VISDTAAFGSACPVTVSDCALQIGGVAGVSQVLIGAVDAGQLTVRLLDVATEAERGRTTVPADAPAAARLAAVRLLRPALDVGRLAIDVDVTGAAISIDGALRGMSPLPPLTLSSGRHEIYVTHADHDGQSFVVDISFEQTATLDVVLAPVVRQRRVTSAEQGLRPVVVLDVLVSPADAMMSAVLTTGFIDALRRHGEFIVATPADLHRLLDTDGLAALRECTSDSCIMSKLGRVAAGGDILIADVVKTPRQVVRARRLSPGEGFVAEAEAPLRPSAAQAIQQIIGQLFPELADAKPLDRLDERLAPPPLPVGIIAATVAGGTLGLVGSGFAIVEASDALAARRDEEAAMWTVASGCASCLTCAALGGTVVALPFVDWAGLRAENDALVRESASRPGTRHVPRPRKTKPRP